MRKKIAVFICAISFGNQRRVLDGILKCAKENNIDIFIFTCHVNYDDSNLRDDGAFSIMLMPDLDKFDGIIIMKNSIRKQVVAEALVEKIIKSGKPAVSVEEEIDGMHYVGISNYLAQKQIVEHLVSMHNVKRMAYVTGILVNDEGRQRFNAFMDAVKEAGISKDNIEIYNGDYIALSGRMAVRHFINDRNHLPEAIVCANDAMAMGVIHELRSFGYEVPQDILVTGFDNDALSHYCKPTLTTADQRQEVIGYRAVSILIDKPSELVRENVEPTVFYGESCGCVNDSNSVLNELRHMYTSQSMQMQQALDEIKNMSMDMAGLGNIEEMCERLKKYVSVSDVKSFYLCLRDKKEWLQEDRILDGKLEMQSLDTSQDIHIPLAFQSGSFGRCPDIKNGDILPETAIDANDADYYIVSPLYYGKTNFGYCVQQGSQFAFESELAYTWVVNVGIAIENIRKFMVMQMMVEKLNSMWMYDTLTGIYNRGGFYHLASGLTEKLKKEDKQCYILFLDLDGLKKINDGLGHEYGDACIKSMAGVLQNTLDMVKDDFGSSICMRYGGDEFVAFGECDEAGQLEDLILLLRKNISLENNQNNKYELACSIGYSVYSSNEMNNLSRLIDEADKKMYQEKKAKHTR